MIDPVRKTECWYVGGGDLSGAGLAAARDNGMQWQWCNQKLPRVGSGVVRIDPLRFPDGCRKRQLNQALSVLSLSLGFFWMYVLCCYLGTLFLGCYLFLCYLCVLSLVVLVRLSVPEQVIDWKDSSPK